MKLIPIVEGCRAIIIDGGRETGRCVVVRARVGQHIDFAANDLWEISICVRYRRRISQVVSYDPYISESCLMRIDGNEDLFEREREQEKVT